MDQWQRAFFASTICGAIRSALPSKISEWITYLQLEEGFFDGDADRERSIATMPGRAKATNELVYLEFNTAHGAEAPTEVVNRIMDTLGRSGWVEVVRVGGGLSLRALTPWIESSRGLSAS
jgi:hypothetical protein